MFQSNISTALILAAGTGKRFWPYSIARRRPPSLSPTSPFNRRLVDEGYGQSERHSQT